MKLRRLLAAVVVALSFSVTASLSAGTGQKAVAHAKASKGKDGTTAKAHVQKPPKAKAAKVAKPKKESSAKIPAVATVRGELRRIQRSDAARHRFARETGSPDGRPGYVIDHRVPLACGGPDDPSNMQWQTIAEAKAKDKIERVRCP